MKKMQIMSVTVFQPESNVSLLSGKIRRNMAGPISRPEMACCFHNLSVFINDPFS